MARSTALSTEVVAQVLQAAGPGGATPEMLQAKLPGVSRSTFTRRLRARYVRTGAVPQSEARIFLTGH